MIKEKIPSFITIEILTKELLRKLDKKVALQNGKQQLIDLVLAAACILPWERGGTVCWHLRTHTHCIAYMIAFVIHNSNVAGNTLIAKKITRNVGEFRGIC